MNDSERQLFSVSTAALQTDYIQHRHQHIKELIRRAKAWRNQQTWGDERPKSYLISLLVITAYHRVPTKDRHGKRLKSFAKKVTEEMKQLVEDISKKTDIDLTIPGKNNKLKLIRTKYSHLLPKTPRIIDPANPANNVYLSGMSGHNKKEGWETFASKIGTIDLTLTAKKIMDEQ